MKLKEIHRKIPGTYTRDGVTVPVTRTETTKVPAFPADWNVIALRSAIGIVLTLTLIAVTWSTCSIGNLLQGGVGYLAAVIFDLGWATALILEYLARYDENKRGFPEKLGWALLLVTMGAIAWDGYNHHSIAMAVVGAFISAFAKALWMGVMRHVNAQLSPEDKQWVTAQVSGAQAAAAVAQVRRTTARIEQRAALELLAMEREKLQVAEAFGLGEADAMAVATEFEAVAIEPPTLADLPKADAVRFVLAQHPDLAVAQVVEALATHDVEVDAAYVRQIINRTKPDAEVIELRK